MILDWREVLPCTKKCIDAGGNELPPATFYIDTITGRCWAWELPMTVNEEGTGLLAYRFYVPTPISIKWDMDGWRDYWGEVHKLLKEKSHGQ